MKSFLLAVAFMFYTVVESQTLPTCALSCFASAIQASGCGMTDYYCQCTSGKQEITEYVYTCLMKSSCSQSDVQSINSAVALTCSSATATASSTALGSNTAGSASITQSATQPVNSDATSPSGAPPLSLTGGSKSSGSTPPTSDTTASSTGTSRTAASSIAASSIAASSIAASSIAASSTAAPPTPASSSHNDAGTLRGTGIWLGLAGIVMAAF